MSSAQRLLILPCLGMMLAGCGQIEQEPLLDDEGKLIPTPPAFEPWLYVTEATPSLKEKTLPKRPTFALTFNEYLDTDSYPSYDVAMLSSGGLRTFGSARYIMTRKQLIWRANGNLREGFEYTFELTMPKAQSLNGAPIWPEKPRGIFTATAAEDSFSLDLDDRPRSFAQDLEPLIQAKCARCHRDPQWGLNPLTYQSLQNAPSTQRDRLLVRPGSPSGSYLMHKLLPDFDDRLYTAQPPPWDAQSAPLTEAEIWSFERWIEGGALP